MDFNKILAQAQTQELRKERHLEASETNTQDHESRLFKVSQIIDFDSNCIFDSLKDY